MLPTLRQLEYVVATADSGQFVEAARRCGVTQPALSKQIREVEELLGVPLFERTRRKIVVTTAAGQEVVKRARRLLVEAREIVEVAHVAAGRGRGLIHLGVLPTVAPYGLPGLLVKMRAELPGVYFAIHELQTNVLLERLRAGSIDLGFLARSFDDHGLFGLDLIEEPFVLLAPAEHTLGVAGPVNAEDVKGIDLLLMEDGHCLRDQATEVCSAAGGGSTSVSAGSMSTLIRMVESGLGPTLVPASALGTELGRDPAVVARGFEAPPPSRTLTLQWRDTSPKVELFRDIGRILQAHYLEQNDVMPKITGPQPYFRSVAEVGR
ncbi:MAG: hydrogen peroxide-inducible genes activator [Myxococcota bacterium]